MTAMRNYTVDLAHIEQRVQQCDEDDANTWVVPNPSITLAMISRIRHLEAQLRALARPELLGVHAAAALLAFADEGVKVP